MEEKPYLNTEDIIQNKDYIKPLNNFECLICFNVVIGPKECTECESIYCENCIQLNKNACPNKCD